MIHPTYGPIEVVETEDGTYWIGLDVDGAAPLVTQAPWGLGVVYPSGTPAYRVVKGATSVDVPHARTDLEPDVLVLPEPAMNRACARWGCGPVHSGAHVLPMLGQLPATWQLVAVDRRYAHGIVDKYRATHPNGAMSVWVLREGRHRPEWERTPGGVMPHYRSGPGTRLLSPDGMVLVHAPIELAATLAMEGFTPI